MTGSQALRIAQVETRRTVRTILDDRSTLLVMVVVAVFALGPALGVGLLLLPELGREVASGSLEPATLTTATAAVESGVAFGWLFLTVIVAGRTVTTTADIDEPACLLVSARIRQIVVGIVGTEALLVSAWVIPPAVVLAAAFGVGAGTILPVAGAVLTAGLVVLSAVPVGVLVGLWVRHLVTVFEPVARYRTPLLVGVGVAYLAAIGLGLAGPIGATVADWVAETPLGWLGHVLLLGVPAVSPASGALIGAVLGSVVVASLALAAAIPSARVHWFADPAREAAARYDTDRGRLERALARVTSRPTRTVAITALRRTKRAPIRLTYVTYPLFGAFFVIQDVAAAGQLSTTIVLVLCAYVVWATGALASLNPLGDAGPALPAVLTSSISGRAVIRGQWLASALVGVPLAFLVAPIAGLASPLSLERTGALVVGTVVATGLTPALAVGVGSLAPRFGAVAVTHTREAVMPSKTAFVAYSTLMLTTVVAAIAVTAAQVELIAGLLSALLTAVPGMSVSVPAGQLTVVAWAVFVGGLCSPVIGYHVAVARFDRYTLA